MHKELIIAAFKKAGEEEMEKGVKNPSLVARAENIAGFVYEAKRLSVSNRTFRDYYNAARSPAGRQEDISIKQLEVINGLCAYLGYADYPAFLEAIHPRGRKAEATDGTMGARLVGWFIKYRIGLTAAVIGLVLLVTIIRWNRQRWMVWQEDHYIEVEYDPKRLQAGELKVYKEERISDFKKIIPDCNTPFFKPDGSENLWYGKNAKGKLEYFTGLGQHPLTGVTLKRITPYMIANYICPTYPD